MLAMALYASEGYRQLFRLESEGLRALDPSVPLVVPQKSAFSKARERVGSERLKRLFEETAVPTAEVGTQGERSAYARVRWVALGEVDTRAIVGASVGAFSESESMLARPLLSRLQAGMMYICDRSYLGFEA